jgi:hypothetical protein
MGNTGGDPGRTVAISREPLLEMVSGSVHEPVLLLYGRPGTNYMVKWRTNLVSQPSWSSGWEVFMTNVVQTMDIGTTSGPVAFYRAVEMRNDAPTISLAAVGTGVFSLTLGGQPGEHYTIQTANSLVPGTPWVTVTSVTLTNAAQIILWTNTGDIARFFRAVKQ